MVAFEYRDPEVQGGGRLGRSPQFIPFPNRRPAFQWRGATGLAPYEGQQQRVAMSPNREHPTVVRWLLAIICTISVVPGDSLAYIQSTPSQEAPSPQQQTAKIPPDQLDSLVAPIALYPDPLLAQTLAASTYPLEIIQMQQWLAKNPGLKDKALAEAVAKQPWDASIQALAA